MISSILIAVGVVALTYVGGKYAFGKDTEREDRRRAAFKVAASLQEKGMGVLPAFLEDYAVGDYSSMAKKLKDAAVTFSNPAAVEAEFASVFAKILQAKLNDPTELAKIADLVQAKLAPKVA